MAKIRDFAKGAVAKGQNNVAVGSTLKVKTSVVSIPPNRYGQRGR